MFQFNNAMLDIEESWLDTSPIPRYDFRIGSTEYRPVEESEDSEAFCPDRDDISDVSFSSPQKKLTFNKLGSLKILDLKEYANKCELLEFNGRIDSARSVYEVAHQLPKLKEVKICVDSAQATYSEEKSKSVSETPAACPSVKILRIMLTLDEYQSEDALRAENGIIKFVESMLMYAGHSLPNMQSLVLHIPQNAKLNSAIESIIDLYPDLKTRTSLLPNASLSGANDFIEMLQASGLKFLSSDKSYCSDDNPPTEPLFSVDRRLRDGYYNSTSEDVSHMEGFPGRPWEIKENDFEQLMSRYMHDLVI